MTFVQRLVVGSVLILTVTIALLLTVAERSLRRDLEDDIARTLESEAKLVVEALRPDSTVWQAAVRRLSSQVGHRISLIDRGGNVRADSDFPMGPLPPLENHLSRPEVRAALAGGRGVASRQSVSVGHAFLYVAIPGGPGVVRVAAGLDQVDAVVGRAQRAVTSAALIALLIGSLLAFAAGRSIAQPLIEISAAARDIAAGAPPRFPRSGTPDIDAVVRALRDMHQQLGERFDELRHEQAESAAIVESMVEGVLAADERGRVVSANAAGRRLLGYGATGELPPLPQLFRTKDAREAVKAVLHGQAVQNRELDIDGHPILINGRPLLSGGAVLVLHDVSDIRRLEAVRRDFVANVSHELKTPLTSISGYAETLLGDMPDAETTHRFLTTILHNARRMQRLVDDLLDLSRIEAGHWHPEPEPLQVAAIAQEVWGNLADPASGMSPEFSLDIGPGADIIVADNDALRQVLTNLFDNAVRYTGSGGHVVCQTRFENGGVAISVADDGTGIAREHLPRIFERFYRADQGRSRQEGGTGLGLAIVKHLVEAHGGRVYADSEARRGTTVTCWFPASVEASSSVS